MVCGYPSFSENDEEQLVSLRCHHWIYCEILPEQHLVSSCETPTIAAPFLPYYVHTNASNERKLRVNAETLYKKVDVYRLSQ